MAKVGEEMGVVPQSFVGQIGDGRKNNPHPDLVVGGQSWVLHPKREKRAMAPVQHHSLLKCFQRAKWRDYVWEKGDCIACGVHYFVNSFVNCL